MGKAHRKHDVAENAPATDAPSTVTPAGSMQ
jgi:hypothetical protein